MSSRNTKFASEILYAAGDYGVGVVLKPLVGDLLDEP